MGMRESVRQVRMVISAAAVALVGAAATPAGAVVGGTVTTGFRPWAGSR